jgi:hypothetical protein
MARMKIEGLIEAVRYTTRGEISLVRAYERHGVVWSDYVLLQRKELLDQLVKGKRFAVGKRKLYLGSIFEIGPSVNQVNGNIVCEGQESTRDHLGGVPLF